MSDIRHHCGVGFIRLLKERKYYEEKYRDPDILLNLMYPLLLRQRNRGQDAAGIATGYTAFAERHEEEYLFVDKMISKDSVVDLYAHLMKEDTYSGYRIADERKGRIMIGHVLYSTVLEKLEKRFVHPFERKHHAPTKRIAIAMNGNFANNSQQRAYLREIGQAPTSKSDMEALTELFGYFLSKQNRTLLNEGFAAFEVSEKIDMCAIMKELHEILKGAYVIEGILGNGDGFFCRDPSGIRPVYYVHNDEFIIAASEMSAIHATFLNYGIKAQEILELPPGHILTVKSKGEVKIEPFAEKTQTKLCMFEAVYFNRINNKGTYNIRKTLGASLAEKVVARMGSLKDAFVSFVPHTSISSALGFYHALCALETKQKAQRLSEEMQKRKFSEEEIIETLKSDISFEKVLTKDMKIRTFISKQKDRSKLVMNAYDTVFDAAEAFLGKKVIIIDDSIVRGTTLEKNVVQTLIKAGAKEIYIVSSCPQIRYPCPYGIEMSVLKKFIAFRATISVIEEKGLQEELAKIEEDARLEQEKIEADFSYDPRNHVERIYNLVTHEEVEKKIASFLKPDDWEGKLEVIYPSVPMLIEAQNRGENLDTACLSGEYPEVGGRRVLNKALLHYFEKKEEIAYA